MQLSFKQLIISHLNYRDIFNAPVSRLSLKRWVGVTEGSFAEGSFNKSIAELEDDGLICSADGYLAVKGKESIISAQKAKSVRTKSILKKGGKFLAAFSKLPFIRYVGVSGSVAAENPTMDESGHVDLDLFVICADGSLWIVFFFERIFTNIIRLLKGDHFYCFNYVTEESFLEVYNKNFYTATELVNMKPLIDKGIYNDFIEANKWFGVYYQSDVIEKLPHGSSRSPIIAKLLVPFNFLFYILFCLFRGIKKAKIKYAFEFLSPFDPTQKCNLKRISNPNGGYQEAIRSRFEKLFKANFAGYWDTGIVDQLFPQSESFSFDTGKPLVTYEFSELNDKLPEDVHEKDII